MFRKKNTKNVELDPRDKAIAAAIGDDLLENGEKSGKKMAVGLLMVGGALLAALVKSSGKTTSEDGEGEDGDNEDVSDDNDDNDE